MSQQLQSSSYEEELLLHDKHEAKRQHPESPDHKEDDDNPVVEDTRDCAPSGGQEKETDPSIIAVFRDFFRAAFCDHYQETYCCATIIPASYCCAGQKVVPDDRAILRKTSTSSSLRDIQLCPSQDSRKRRIKPLAIAVGFNYANDMDGRPVVITPGRKTPIDPMLRQSPNPNSRSSSRASRNRSPHAPIHISARESPDSGRHGVAA